MTISHAPTTLGVPRYVVAVAVSLPSVVAETEHQLRTSAGLASDDKLEDCVPHPSRPVKQSATRNLRTIAQGKPRFWGKLGRAQRFSKPCRSRVCRWTHVSVVEVRRGDPCWGNLPQRGGDSSAFCRMWRESKAARLLLTTYDKLIGARHLLPTPPIGYSPLPARANLWYRTAHAMAGNRTTSSGTDNLSGALAG